MPNMGIIFLFFPQLDKKSSIKSKKKRRNKKYSNFKEEPFYRKPKHKKHSNKKYQNFSSKKMDEKDIKYFKCGKKGHITPNDKIKIILKENNYKA